MGIRASTLIRWLVVCVFWGGIAVAQPTEPPADEGAGDRDPTITVFLARHAEKVRDRTVADPPLTEAGRQRARDLAMTLSEAGIEVVFTTQWLRTRQTAAPTAEHLGLEALPIEARDDFIQQMVRRITELEGKTILVVGHSDTTPELARALGASEAPDIADDDFDDLYQVVISPTDRRFVHLRYGHPTP